MHLPEAIVPLLDAVQRNPAVARGLPREFWRHGDHRTWVDAFMELGIALYNSDLPEEGLPRGYAYMAHLFDWEAQCQSSGWRAISHRGDTFPKILAAYEAVGLGEEAKALREARRAWDASGEDHDAATAAYALLRHAYSVDLDRIEYLAAYFVDNADALLYVTAD